MVNFTTITQFVIKMNISAFSPLTKLKIHWQHIHKFLIHVIKGFVKKFARPRASLLANGL